MRLAERQLERLDRPLERVAERFGQDLAAIREAARAGDPFCQYWMGHALSARLIWGGGAEEVPRLPPDAGKAARWLRRAARQGLPDAAHLLGLLLSRHLPGQHADPVEAASWFRIAAERGHPEAAFRLGDAHRQGRGAEQSDRDAAWWLNRAALLGHAEARRLLLEMLRRDPRLAQAAPNCANWLRVEASTPGDWQHALAYAAILARGYDVPRPEEAIAWLQRAAETGNRESQLELALAYEEGRGTPQNFLAAYAWYSIAAATAVGPAGVRIREHRDRVGACLTRESMDAAQRWAAECFEILQARRAAERAEREAVAHAEEAWRLAAE